MKLVNVAKYIAVYTKIITRKNNNDELSKYNETYRSLYKNQYEEEEYGWNE